MFAAALLVACGGFATPPQGQIPVTLGYRAAALLAEAIRIDTSNPPGNERALAEHLASFLAAEGIETAVVPLPEPDSTRAAVWARVPASGAGRRGPTSGA
ncbi:MAG: hypothetical protein ABFS41_05335, partial [Myxococcota bacterium]